MNTGFRNIYRIVLIGLAATAIEVWAENAEQTTAENSPTPLESKPETGNKPTQNKTKDTISPKTEVDLEEETQDRIFRPSEDISEDLVIAFPVDI